QANTDICSYTQQHILVTKQLEKEISSYKIQNNYQQIIINDYNIELYNIQNMLSEKLSKKELLQSMIKILKLLQKDLSKKESENRFLKTKISKLDSKLISKVNKLK
ncbi:17218_t:CDS:1, partial [Cetraspora pellucida]